MSYRPPRVDGYPTVTVISAIDTMGEVYAYATAPASAAYPLANLALYVPFSVSETVTVFEGWVVAGATAGGNYDIGVYSAAGSLLTSSGSTARTNSTVNNTTTMTNLDLVPGVRYYMAFAANSTNNYLATTHAAGLHEAMGILESTSSFALPSSPTLARTTRAYIPHFGLNLYTVAL
jgi:hypothetical protein